MRTFLYLLLASILTSVFPASAQGKIPVGDFFKDAEFTSVSLSPTGEYITVSVPQGDRTVLAAFRVSDMKLVGKWDYGEKKHIDSVVWVNDERFLMYVSIKLGRYDFRVGVPDVYASNVDGTLRRDMPALGYYSIADIAQDDPRTILVQRSVESAFLSKYDIYSGEVRTVATAPLRFGSFVVDNNQKVRYAFGAQDNQERVTLRRDGEKWTKIHGTDMGGAVRTPFGFDEDNKRVFFGISAKGEPARLVLIDPETEEETQISSNPNVDLGGFLPSSDNKRLLAVSYEDGLPRYDFVNKDDPESKIYAGLIQAFPNHALSFDGISKDGRFILFLAYSDVDPGSYYLFDSKTGKAKFLLAARDWIKPSQMSEMRPITVAARDGTKIHGYLTVPAGSTGKNLPLILHPHGGPHGPRDNWGFNSEVQFLANRGYAVLQINFRGSGGYGNAYERAGYKKWGTLMIDDMTDAVDWAIREGIADKDRICTYGASYGGYAALQSVVRNPDKYRCTIGYVGVYSLGLLYSDGSADTPALRAFLDRVIPSSEADRQAQSPLNNIDKIHVPVMLVAGAKDPIVPIVHYNKMEKALKDAGHPAEITIVEPKESHGFYDYENQVELYTSMEKFLDKYIGSKSASASTSP